MENQTESNIECNNHSPIVMNGSELTCKLFIYIKESDTEELAVNNRVVATQSENGDITVTSLAVIEAFNRRPDRETPLLNFSWMNLPAIKKVVAEYLKEELASE